MRASHQAESWLQITSLWRGLTRRRVRRRDIYGPTPSQTPQGHHHDQDHPPARRNRRTGGRTRPPLMHMNLALQNKPHWQGARQALGQFTASQDAELKAWRAFRDAAKTEGWLAA